MKKTIYTFISTLMLIAFALTACVAPAAPISEGPSLEQRQAAATAQANLNQLQVEAAELETLLDEQLSNKYTGMTFRTEGGISILIYLVDGSKEDLQPFVENTRLYDLITVMPAEQTRAEIRQTRERLKAELQELGISSTTSIRLDPVRLELYVTDLEKTQEQIVLSQIDLPEYVLLVEKEELPTGG